MKYIILLVFPILVLTSCKNKFDVNTSDVKTNVSFYNLCDEFNKNASQPAALEQKLSQIDTLLPSYLDYSIISPYLTGLGNAGADPVSRLAQYVNDPKIQVVSKEITRVFSGKSLKDDVEALWAHARYYFPEVDSNLNIILFNSAFTKDIEYDGVNLVVGGEWFLGQNHPIIQDDLNPHNFPQFVKQKMDYQYLIPSVASGLAYAVIMKDVSSGNTLVDQAVFAGKAMYLVDAFLPDVADSLKIGYTSYGWEWAKASEEQIWQFWIDQERLNNSSRKNISNYFSEAPFTAEIDKESPDRLGVFMGWQMVRDYMNANPDLTLQELLNTSTSRILKSYRP